MKNASKLLFSGIALLGLTACGNKGPLILPEKPSQIEQPSADAPTSQDQAADDAIDEGDVNDNG